MATKERLHRLVDELPEAEAAAAERYLEYLRNMGDPVARTLAEAPYDDEQETEEEARAVAEAWEAVRKGDVVPDEDLDAELAS